MTFHHNKPFELGLIPATRRILKEANNENLPFEQHDDSTHTARERRESAGHCGLDRE